MIFPDSFERKTGFEAIREALIQLCESAPGVTALNENLAFSTKYDIVCRRLRETDEMRAVYATGNPLSFGRLADQTENIRHAAIPGNYLLAENFLSVKNSLECIDEILRYFSTNVNDDNSPLYPSIFAHVSQIKPFVSLRAQIDNVIDKYGDVKDSASPMLAQIRRSLQQTQSSLGSIMKRVIGRAAGAGVLEADTAAVVRDGRLVLPVQPMNKYKIPGIVHDESASGKTVFIEPAELVEANNRIRQLQMDERREIINILRALTDAIRPFLKELEYATAVIGYLDFVYAKARYADLTGACLPKISDKSELEWYHAEHPELLLSLRRQNKEIVPLDIRLSSENRILIISGPNAGGKSVCLKTVGVLQYMTQCGLLPTVYENSHFGIFENIFINIGDDQSIEDDLSTYSSHLRDMKFFLQHGNSTTLLLIDEFGGGTEPQIGGAIAQAMLKQFCEEKMWGVVTTHFQNIKQFAEETPGLVNGSMIYDRHLMRPTFRLSIGNPGSSFAIEIARKIGLPDTIIKDAENIVGSEYVNLDKYLLDIARDKKYWANKREQIKLKEKKLDAVLNKYEEDAETLRRKRREIVAEAQETALKIIEGSNAAVERTILEIKASQADKEKTRAARQKLEQERRQLRSGNENTVKENEVLKKAPKRNRNNQAKPIAPTAKPFAVRDNVKLEGQTAVGTILEIEGNSAIVNFGALKTKVDLKRLQHTIAKATKPSASGSSLLTSQSIADSRQRQLNFKQEIDVRGMRLDEAVQAVTYFIDDAIQFNAGRVRILHGTGTGALREGIRQYLKATPGVKSYRDEDVRFGGAGITVVDFD